MLCRRGRHLARFTLCCCDHLLASFSYLFQFLAEVGLWHRCFSSLWFTMDRLVMQLVMQQQAWSNFLCGTPESKTNTHPRKCTPRHIHTKTHIPRNTHHDTQIRTKRSHEVTYTKKCTPRHIHQDIYTPRHTHTKKYTHQDIHTKKYTHQHQEAHTNLKTYTPMINIRDEMWRRKLIIFLYKFMEKLHNLSRES